MKLSKGEKLSVEKLKQIQLDILSVIDKFCRENNIKYSMGCGTMLGAVRHKGFIPWDDDIDIYMLRNEYEKLMKLFPVIYKNIKIAELKRDKKWDRAYAKAYDDRTEMEDAGQKCKIGIGIDVFPIDKVPEDNAEWIRYDKQLRLLQYIYKWKISMWFRKGRSPWKYLFIPFTKMLLYPITRRNMATFIERYSQKYRESNSSLVFECCFGMFAKDQRFKRKTMEDLVEMPFEDRMFYGMKDYEDYLNSAYGDWEKLPPVEKQVAHHLFNAWWK